MDAFIAYATHKALSRSTALKFSSASSNSETPHSSLSGQHKISFFTHFSKISSNSKECPVKYSADGRQACSSSSSFQEKLPISPQATEIWNELAFSADSDPTFSSLCRKSWTSDKVCKLRTLIISVEKFLAEKAWCSIILLPEKEENLLVNELQEFSNTCKNIDFFIEKILSSITSQEISVLTQNNVIFNYLKKLVVSIFEIENIEIRLNTLIKKFRKSLKLKKSSDLIPLLASVIHLILSDVRELTFYLATLHTAHIKNLSYQGRVQ